MSYDTAKLKKCGNFCPLTWLIFANLVTVVLLAGLAHAFLNYTLMMALLLHRVTTAILFQYRY